MEQFSRTELLLGEEAIEKLKCSRVAVFGIGGVGGYVVEALTRSGVGNLDLIDSDQVSLSNLNRQIIATHNTVGRDKVDVAAERVQEINPDAVVVGHKVFYTPETADQFDFTQYDYVVDAIDTVTGKLQIVEEAVRCKVPVISSMGTGNKLDPSRLRISDISKTSMDPLARIMRKELKKRGITHLKVVWSNEKPLPVSVPEQEKGETTRRAIPGSNAYVPATAGMIIASEVIRDLTGVTNPEE